MFFSSHDLVWPRKKRQKTVRYKRSLGRKYTQFKGFYDKSGPDNRLPPYIL